MTRLDYPALGETLFDDVLPNGLRIITVRKKGFRKAFAMFATRYGGADRRFQLDGEWIDTPWGVAHYLEHKMFDMPEDNNVLADLSARGADPNAFTSNGMTAYHVTCTDDFYENLRSLLVFVSTPYFTPESVAKEQGIIGQEILMGENDPTYVAYFELMKALYAHHPIRDNEAGTLESIAQITPEILYHCHKVFYHPSNMVLVCVCDADPERIAAIAQEVLPSEPGVVPVRDYGEPETPWPMERRVEKAMAVSAPLAYMGVKLTPAESGRALLRQQLTAELALDYLIGPSSALYAELYDKGLLGRDFGTDVDSSAGTLTVLLGGESKDPDAVLTALTDRVGLIARRGIDPASFERCRRASYGQALGRLDRFYSYACMLAQGAFDGWGIGEMFDLLKEITPEEAADFLCEAITPDRLALSVVRPER